MGSHGNYLESFVVRKKGEHLLKGGVWLPLLFKLGFQNSDLSRVTCSFELGAERKQRLTFTQEDFTQVQI